MGASTDIEELNFNFTNACNMNCGFCYVPFRRNPLDESRILRIFERISALGPTRVVIGGGDPFLFSRLLSVVRDLLDRGHAVHVDSNFKVAKRHAVMALRDNSGRLSYGLPLDGSSEVVHSLMRGERGHFDLVVRWLRALVDGGFDCKVNTVVSRLNLEDIDSLEALIAGVGVTRWSLYQFWPMARGLANTEEFAISEDLYRTVVDRLRSRSDLTIGGGSIDERRHGYLFVRSDGSVYTVSPDDHRLYLELGDIFSDGLLDRWRHAVAAEGTSRIPS